MTWMRRAARRSPHAETMTCATRRRGKIPAALVAAICAKLKSIGQLLVCYRCGDIEALIVSFLVLDHKEQAWALCGKCKRKLPLDGALE